MGLLINLQGCRLVRLPLAHYLAAVILEAEDAVAPAICGLHTTSSNASSFSRLLDEFPLVLVPNFSIDMRPAHGVEQVVPTDGPPVSVRPCRLAREKLAVARE